MNKKKIGLAVLALALCIGLVSAALLEYYGRIITTVNVNQAIWLDGKPYTEDVTEDFDIVPPKVILTSHYLESKAEDPITMQFNTLYEPDGIGIDVSYLKSIDYKVTVATFPSRGIPIDVTVEDIGGWIQWTFDYFAHAESDDVEKYLAYVESDDVDDKLAAMVAISYDENEPAYLVHNNDGMLAEPPIGTWLYCPNLALVHDYGSNTPVEDLDWIDATTDFEHGKIVVKLLKEKLVDEGATLHWAVYVGIRSGGCLPYTLSTYPENFDWISFESATILEPIEQPFTLAAGEHLDFYIRYDFAPDLMPDIYTITTEVQPA